MCVYRALYGLPGYPVKPDFPSRTADVLVALIVAEVSYMFGMFPAVRDAGSPVKAPPPKPLLIPSGFCLCESEVSL